jgi:hypothetical protein
VTEQDRTPQALVSVQLTYHLDPPIDGLGWYQKPFKIKGLIASWNTSGRFQGVQVWGARQKADGTLYDENLHKHVWGDTEALMLQKAGYQSEDLIDALEAAKWVVR